MPGKKTPNRKPAETVEGREAQIASMAYDLAERQIRDGTASAQVITHFLKYGSSRETLEKERLQKENALLEARVDSLHSSKRVEELYGEAIKAMRSYAGQLAEEDDLDDVG